VHFKSTGFVKFILPTVLVSASYPFFTDLGFRATL